MRSYLQMFLRGIFLVGFVASIAVWQRQENQWDYMVFTQDWPVACCIDINDSGRSVCHFPQDVKSWTIHGLWPDQENKKGPFYCNDSYPFDEKAIMDLEPEMLVKWPNLMSDTARTSFWKHEWEKHGTCATSLPSLATEHDYFKQTLALNSRFDLLKILVASNIIPTNLTRYKLSDFRSAIEDFTQSKINLQCIMSKDYDEQALIQLEICLNKSYETIDCVTNGDDFGYAPSWDKIPYNPIYKPCREDLPVQYFPLPHVK